MRRLYPPPRHLRADEEDLDAALAEYRRSLARFDEPTLQQAWRQIVARHTYWCWPNLAEIVQAAEQVRKATRPQDQGDAWVDRATKLSDDYVRKFMKTTQAAVKAREGGYEPALKRYVREVSWVQSQYIEGRNGIGFDHGVIFGPGPRDKEAEQRFFDKAREQAATGHIKVSVPNEMLNRWRAQGEARGR